MAMPEKIGWDGSEFFTMDILLANDVQVLNMRLSRTTAQKTYALLREHYGDTTAIPAELTAEQVEIALLEAELDEAVADKRIERWRVTSPGAILAPRQWGIVVWLPKPNASLYCPFQEWRDSRVDVVRSAVEYVRGLQKPLRDVYEMSSRECCDEMNERGWTFVDGSACHFYIKGDRAVRLCNNSQESYWKMLREAREIDAKDGKP
jgi:hypothetical protein